jgi:hypothetical protein
MKNARFSRVVQLCRKRNQNIALVGSCVSNYENACIHAGPCALTSPTCMNT